MADFTVSSEIHLPELLELPASGQPADVEVRLGTTPDHLEGAVQSMPEAQVTPDAVLLTIPGVARMLVSHGRRVRVDPVPGAMPEDVRLFLLGSAFGAVYFLRGYFPLHASVVVVNGAAVAFAGDSGMGKSTMAAWMSRQGHELLCDDVCILRILDGEATAYPAYPRLKLNEDVMQEFGLDSRQLRRDHSRTDKYHFPASEAFRTEPAPLRHVCFLRFDAALDQPTVTPLPPARAVPLLRDNTYRFQFISGLELTRRHFLHCVQLAGAVHCSYLDRPRRLLALAQCQGLVEARVR